MHTLLTPSTDTLYAYDQYLLFLEAAQVHVPYDDFIKEFERLQWQHAWDHRKASLPLPSFSLEEGQARLTQHLHDALDRGGKWAFHVDCGTGKTHGAALTCLDLWQHHAKTSPSLPHMVFLVANNHLARELEHTLRALAPEHLDASAAQSFELELIHAPKRTQDNCKLFPVISAAHRVSHTAASALCRQCPHRDTCPFMNQVKGPRGKITLLTHELAFSYLQGRTVDLLVIDEGIMDAMYPARSFSLSQLATLKAHDNFSIKDDAWARLTDLLASGHSASSTQLAEAVPPDALLYHDDQLIHHLVQEAVHASPDAQLDLLAQAPPLEALHALQACVLDGWHGAHVHHGELSLLTPRPLHLEGARTVLYLDATTSPLHAQAVLGKDHTLIRLPIDMPAHVQIHQLDWAWSKSLLKHGKIRYPLNQRRMQALVKAYDSPKTAWAIHKDHRLCDEIASTLHRAEHEKRVLHYGATRGSNAFEDFDTIVVAARHVPQGVLQARTELLCRLTGASVEQAYAEAQLVLEEGEMLQALHRIRPTRSTRPTTLVIADDRYLELIEPTHIQSIDVLVMDHFNEVRGSMCLDTLFERHITDFGWCMPSVLRAVNMHNDPFTRDVQGNTSSCMFHSGTQLHEHKKKFLNHVNLNHSNSWTKYASLMGYKSLQIRTSQGREPLILIHGKEEPRRDQVAAYLALLGVYWFEWGGERVEILSVQDRLRGTLAYFPDEKRIRYDTLADLMGYSLGHTRRLCREAGWDEEALRAQWCELSQAGLVVNYRQNPSDFLHPVHKYPRFQCDTLEREARITVGRAPPDS